MENLPAAQPTTNQPSLASRAGWAILIVATLYVCYFSHLGAIGFVGPDEPRYAWIAREMAETGDWVTPRLYGKPWFEKPPLFYWEAALSFKLFGVSEAAARLPSAVSALLATLALGWLARHMYGAETARWLLLLLPTTVGMIGFSHAAATDMPFSAMLTIAMVFAAVVLGLVPSEASRAHYEDSGQASSALKKLPTPWLALILFGISLGAAVLAKGPAGIVLCGGAVFFWAIFTKRWRDAFRLLRPAAIAAFCLTALPWYILCARRNPDFFRVFIIEHNFKRYLTPEFQHLQPFWFYVPILCVSLMPWFVLFGWTVFTWFQKKSPATRKNPATLLLVSWSVFCFLFFSVSQSKLPGYILPAVPPVGLLLSLRFSQAPSPRNIGFLAGLFAGLLFIAAELTYWHSDASTMYLITPGHLVGLTIGVIACANLSLGLTYSTWGNQLLRNSFGFLTIALLLGALLVWPNYLTKAESGLISPKALAEGLPKYRFPLDRVFVWKSANRSWSFGTSFYLHSEVPDWDPDKHKQAFVITGWLPCSQIAAPGYNSTEIRIGDPGGLWFVCRLDPQRLSGLP